MSIILKKFVASQLLSGAAANLYQAGANEKALIGQATVCNTGTTAYNITVHLVASGGTVANANMIIDAKQVATGVTTELTEIIGHVLEGGESIHAFADTADQLSLRVSGRLQ